MKSSVQHRVLSLGGAGPEDIRRILQAVAAPAEKAAWALKIKISPPGMPTWIEPVWLQSAAAALGCGPASFCFDTVSISTEGLETTAALGRRAVANGLDRVSGLRPFVAAGGEEQPDPQRGAGVRAEGLDGAGALGVLNPVRPDPHFGFRGVIAELGVGMLAREGKLALHRQVRPQVDTPLCAGCGSCMVVCLYDAITLKGGRAHILHERCTGCGECMSACHLEGLTVEDKQDLAGFQKSVAASAVSVRATFGGPQVYLNLLLGLDSYVAGPGRRMALALNQGRLLAGTDPVAVDQAAWDLLSEACGGSIRNWHGYPTDPAVMLAEAESLGLGSREYHLQDQPSG